MRFILLNLVFLSLAIPTLANDFFVSDRTFFSNGKLDRIYFDPNGEFKQQLENKFDAMTAGDLLRGTWELNDHNYELCMNYQQPKLNMICFDMIENSNAHGYSVFDKSGKRHFIWKNYRNGNWLLSQSGMTMIKNAIKRVGVKNSATIDEKMNDYYIGKIFEGFDGVFSYILNTGNGVYRDKVTKQKVPYSYQVSNLRTILKSSDGSEGDNVLITLGDEFLEDKPEKAYFYAQPDLFYIEGGDKFTLTPINDHPEKDFFLKD